MSFLSRIASMLRNLFRKEQVEYDLGEELRSYLDLLVEEKMRDGMSKEMEFLS